MSTDLTRLLDVARAAYCEVGGNPDRIHLRDDDQLCYPGTDRMARRACELAVMATAGPDTLVRCRCCALCHDMPDACTPVRDTLRGITCEQWA